MYRWQRETLAFLMLAFSSAVPAAMAEDTAGSESVEAAEHATGAVVGVDTSEWQCRFCPYQYGYFGFVDFGTLHVSDQSDIFESYTGLSEGWHLLGDGFVRYVGENGQYWKLDFQDLGLDSRRIEAEGGRQGSYTFSFGYRQLPSFATQGAVTPFGGNGGGTLVLPPDWVSASSTAGMTALDGSLHPIAFGTERETFDMGVLFDGGTQHWNFGVDYRHETKNGIRPWGAGFFIFNTSLFAKPIEYVTDQIDVVAAYTAKHLQAEFGYYGSVFDQGIDALTWQNPFDPLTPGTIAGRTALEPDNQFHQIFTTIHWQVSGSTDAVGSISYGRGKQDESFLPYTINPEVDTNPLPRDSTDGDVKNTSANLQLTTRATDKLTLNAKYRFSNRDNTTPQSEFSPVVTDSFASGNQTNLPYSFQRNNGSLSFDYRLPGRRKLEFGYDRLSYRRAFQDIVQTKQDTLFGKIDIFANRRFDMNLKLAWSERDGSAYSPNENVNPPENPGMRRFNMADRDRGSARLFFNARPSDTVNFGGSVEYADDNYGAEYGRTSAEYGAWNLDASWIPTTNVLVFGWYSDEDIRASVDGNDGRDWFANTRDQLETFGLGIEAQQVGDDWDLGLDINQSRSAGAYNVQIADDPMSPFPGLLTNLESVRFYAVYAWRPKWEVGFKARYDRFHSDDWALDGVDVDTVSELLSLGNEAPDYDIWVAGVWLRYAL